MRTSSSDKSYCSRRRLRRMGQAGLCSMLLLLLFNHVDYSCSSSVNSISCRTDVKNLFAKTTLSPYVFEGTVIGVAETGSTGHHHHPAADPPLHSVTLRVSRVYKGNVDIVSNNTSSDNKMINKGQISLIFRSKMEGGSSSLLDTRCTFEPSIFQMGRKYIVFATDNHREVTTGHSMVTAGGHHDDDVFDFKIPTFSVFCEPVALNKKSSRRMQKILRRAKPPAVTGLNSTSVRLNERLKLTCKTKGRPHPTVTWFKDGKPLAQNLHFTIKTKGALSRLIIANVREEDGGRYECRASVDSAMSAAVAMVTVRKPRRRPPPPTNRPDARAHPNIPMTGSSHPTKKKPCPFEGFCQNNGTCIIEEAILEPFCICPDGYQGYQCTTKVPDKSDVKLDWAYKNIFTIVVILGVLLCITILSNVAYFIFRAKRKIQREKKEMQTRELLWESSGSPLSKGGNAIEMQHVISNRARKGCVHNKYSTDDFHDHCQGIERLDTLGSYDHSYEGIHEMDDPASSPRSHQLQHDHQYNLPDAYSEANSLLKSHQEVVFQLDDCKASSQPFVTTPPPEGNHDVMDMVNCSDTEAVGTCEECFGFSDDLLAVSTSFPDQAVQTQLCHQ